MALTSSNMMNIGVGSSQKTMLYEVSCSSSRKRDSGIHPYKVVEITPPPKSLGLRCLPPVSSHHHHFFFRCCVDQSQFNLDKTIESLFKYNLILRKSSLYALKVDPCLHCESLKLSYKSSGIVVYVNSKFKVCD